MINYSNSPLGRPRILFVDDSRLMRAAAVKLFSDDFDLVLAEDGLQAWDMINSDQSIQVVFTDLVMPKLDGFEFLDRVRAAKDDRIREMPVIVVTDTDGKTDAKKRAFQMGATDFVSKPFDATDLNVRTHAHLRHQTPDENLPDKATFDAETGLLNRTGMINLLEKDIAFCIRHNKQLFTLYIEIDAFKELFIRVGRKNAEMIIDQIAHIISEEAYQRDSVARLGLSSFAISMPGADPDSSLLIAHRVTQIVNNFNINFKGDSLPLSVSSGVCIVEEGVFADAPAILDVAQEAREEAYAKGISQAFFIDFTEHQKQFRRQNAALSLDEMLGELQAGYKKEVLNQMDIILDKLQPFFSLMTEAQKERYFARTWTKMQDHKPDSLQPLDIANNR